MNTQGGVDPRSTTDAFVGSVALRHNLSMIRVALPFGIGTPEEKRDSYRNALRQAAIEPVENVADLRSLDGLLLAGGTDVDPALYGAACEAETDQPDRVRDGLEGALLDQALERDLPVLGICRGLQFLNVRLGGTLRQHIDGHKCPKVREVHGIAIAPGSRLEAILATREYVVNSRHHQAADRVGTGLAVTATAPDGVVEALELPGKRFVLAVQWHPEARTDGPDARLFEAFREAMRDANRLR
jgi:gamma-glutamyl-gamma-aminobutyrate hydrolase PuuD